MLSHLSCWLTLSPVDLLVNPLTWADLLVNPLTWADLLVNPLTWADLLVNPLTWADLLVNSQLIWADLLVNPLTWADLLVDPLTWADLLVDPLTWADLRTAIFRTMGGVLLPKDAGIDFCMLPTVKPPYLLMITSYVHNTYIYNQTINHTYE